MKKRAKKIGFILAILLLLCIFFFCGWKVISYFAEGARSEAQYDELSDMLQEARPTEDATTPTFDWSSLERLPEEEIIEMPDSPYIIVTNSQTGKLAVMLPEYEPLFQINSDIVGWISIEGTNIDYPVVQRKDITNYYIYRDFYGRQIMRGCIYVKEDCDVFAPTDNVVMYGHMMQDGSMFADLSKYTSKKFWQEHQFVQFDTLRGRHTYQIVCVFKTTANSGGFPYHTFVEAEYDSDWDDFWVQCQENAFYDTGLDINCNDKIITLSTCEYTLKNGRLVVVAKRVE